MRLHGVNEQYNFWANIGIPKSSVHNILDNEDLK